MKIPTQPSSPEPQAIALEGRRLLTLARPVEGIRALDLFRAGAGGPRALWIDAEQGEQIAGLGSAKRLTAAGPQRFAELQTQVNELAGLMVNCSSNTGIEMPRLMGGFGFAEQTDADELWASFGSAQFILPSVQLIETEGEAWLVVTHEADAGVLDRDSLAELHTELDAWVARLKELPSEPSDSTLIQSAVVGGETQIEWTKALRDALGLINSGKLEKLVLTRGREFEFEGQIDVDAVVERLLITYPNCFVFAFEPAPGHVWLGATPERLARVLKGNLKTMALAGSVQRGKDELEDNDLGRALLASEKERSEHQLVIDDISKNLEAISSNIAIENGPDLQLLPNIQHLRTVLTAVLRPEVLILDAVACLHPTAALCGYPRRAAMAELTRLESFGRGWFGGPIGWLDLTGNGDLSVAIRSAVTAPGRVRLYAGAGIVAGSVAEREWAETELKFLPMAENLFGEIA